MLVAIAVAATAGVSAGATYFPRADALVPSAGSVLTGLSGGSAAAFTSETGKHPAVYGAFVTWGGNLAWAFADARAAHSRLMLHISTTQGYGAPQQITPAGIASGAGDGYLLTLSAAIASYGKPVYIRLLPEMNQANNAYSAFNADGSSRGPDYSPTVFRAAWRRVVIILRGGSVSHIDTQLAAIGLSPLRGSRAGSVAVSPISFVWTPQTAGSPAIAANAPAAYWPGSQYVDWIGTDFYSKFPNFAGLETLYDAYPDKPFAFGEWAMWGGDAPSFVSQLFAFIDSHPRVQMALYNQGLRDDGPFRLEHFPSALALIRRDLSSARFVGFASEWGGSG